MRILLRSLVGLILLLAVGIAIMYALGAAIPEQHTASATVLVQAPVQRVWALIQNTADQPHWRTGLTSLAALPPQNGHPCWTEHNAMGAMAMCETEAVAPLLRIVRIADPGLPFGGEWVYVLSPTDASTTRVTITENGTTRPRLYRFLGHYVFHEDTAIKQYEHDLQAAATAR